MGRVGGVSSLNKQHNEYLRDGKNILDSITGLIKFEILKVKAM
jgi:hypothetical protein